MSAPEQPPNDSFDPNGTPEPAFTMRFTRDTLILVAAIAFLAVAILLALVFPPAPASVSNATPTLAFATAQATLAAVATVPQATDSTAPSLTPITAATQQIVTAPTSLPEPPAQNPPAYPAPGGATALPTVALATGVPVPTAAFSTPGGATTPTPPIFSPSMPTAIIANATSTPPPIAQAPTRSAPTAVTQPTTIPAVPAPTSAPVAPAPTTQPGNSSPRPTAVPPPPPPPPATVLRGTIYWRAENSPYVISQDLVVGPGAALMIDPGVEVRLAPGVSLTAQGKLYALGQPDRPVRIVGTGSRWEGIFGSAGSDIVLEHTEIQGGGAGGTVIGVENGALAMRGVRVNDNGGQIRVDAGRLEVRDSEIAGNDMPYGAPLEASYRSGGTAIVTNTRIGGNRLSNGAPNILLRNEGTFGDVQVDLQGNLLVGQTGPNLTLSAARTPFRGTIACNSLLNGTNGLSIRSDTLQTPGFPLSIHDNAIDDHVPPIVPIYLQYGIGRGATSEVAIDMRNNWWGSEIGPYEPDRLGDGRGDSVGENIEFIPWLTAWPSCAPRP